MADKRIRLGMIGAGIFAREAHMTSLNELRHLYDLVAVCSRTQASARARADQWLANGTTRPDVHTDVAALLARPDIDAVDIVLPINVMPNVVKQALRAGKHVFSEKPIAPTVEEALQLLAIYQNHEPQVWMVGENWRYESAFRLAAETVLQGAIGAPITCHFSAHVEMSPQNRYWQTGWRREWEFMGGWLLDFGVHHIAVLRAALGEVAAVQATATLANPFLKTLDTLAATLRFESGVLGTYNLTCAANSQWPPTFSVVGDNGSLSAQIGKIEVLADGDKRVIECPKRDGVAKEFDAFAQAILHGQPHLNTPVSALRDVDVMEAMFQSVESGEQVQLV